MPEDEAKKSTAQLVWLGKLLAVVLSFAGAVAGAVWGVMESQLDDCNATVTSCRSSRSTANDHCDERVNSEQSKCDARIEESENASRERLDHCYDKLLYERTNDD